MPELPEVQTTTNGINKVAKGLVIKDVWTDYGGAIHKGKDHIKNTDFFQKIFKKVIGKKILNTERKGKNILIHLSHDLTILIHMKMTGHILYGTYKINKIEFGKLQWVPAVAGTPLSDPFNRFIHFVITLSNSKHLVMSDTRKFAKVTLIETPKLHESSHLKGLGPEPLEKDFTWKLFKERLNKKPNGRIKNTLMMPEIIAGVGNIYSDEALWASGIHPETLVRNIPDDCMKLLHKSVIEVLKKGIDFGGDSMSDYRKIYGEKGQFQGKHNAYRKTGTKCARKNCKGIITRKMVGGRSSHFCSIHQKSPLK